MTPTQAIAALFLLVIVDNAGMLQIAVGPFLGTMSDGVAPWFAWGWLALMLGTIAALLRRPSWAVPLIVLLIPASTILLGLSFIPFVMLIVPPTLRPYALFVANLVVLVVSVFLIRRSRTPSAVASAG